MSCWEGNPTGVASPWGDRCWEDVPETGVRGGSAATDGGELAPPTVEGDKGVAGEP